MDNLLQKLMLGGSTAALCAAMSMSGAHAQGDADIEQVVVSASRITIAGYTQPTPVTVVGAAQLEKDAFSNIQDAVRELPAVNSPPSSVGANNGAAISGTSGENLLNLRALGTLRTLILYDGQRIVQSHLAGGVDISTIPSTVVQRVDIVTGGASAAWGSDAVAGVVNFVLNKNFNGLKGNVEVSDNYSNQYRGIGGNVVWGGDMLGGRGHIVLAGSYELHPDVVIETYENWYRGSYWVSNPLYVAGGSQPQLIVANDVGIASATQGGIISSSPAVTAANSPTGQATAANALRGIEFVGGGIPQLVNYGNLTLNTLSNGGSLTAADGEQMYTMIGIPNAKYTAFAFARYKITDTIQASLQLNYGYNTGKDFAQPTLQTALVIKSDNAYIPASVRATIQATGITSFTMGVISTDNYDNYNTPQNQFFKRAENSLGPSIDTNHRQLMRGVFTLDGTIGDNWSWTAFYQHSTVRYWSHVWSNILTANLALAEDAVTVTTANRLASGAAIGSVVCRSSLAAPTNGCSPLDVFGNGVASQAAMKYVNGNNADFQDMQTNQDQAEGSMQGTLPWQLPAGPVAVVFGAGYRKEAGVNFADPNGFAAGWNIGNWTRFPSSSYNVIEGFGEVDAPILKNNIVNSLDFTMAGRMTSYSTSGLVETWKLGANSQVTDDFRLRTTFSVDIRAPILNELFALASQSNSSTTDPKTHAPQSVFTNTSGNPNLIPETARTISGGVVVTPHWIDGLAFSVDYYTINITNGIQSIASGVILNQCDPSKQSVIVPGTLGNINDPLCTHLVFNGAGNALSFIEQSPINIASEKTSGFDVEANYTMDFWEGSLAWHAVGNLNDEHTTAQPGTATSDSAGTGGTPKWKGVLSADYTTGPYSFTIQSRWYGTSKLTNSANTGNLANAQTFNLYPTNLFEIPVVAYLDLRGSYKWNDNISFYGAIDNSLDTPPPLIPMNNGNIIHANPTNTGTYDLLGRQFRFGVRFNY